MKKLNLAFLAALILLLPLNSYAGLESFLGKPDGYLAPYIYGVSNGSLASSPADPPDADEPNEMKYDTSGYRYGVQLGASFGSGLTLGMDVSWADLKYKFHHPDGDDVEDAKLGVAHYGGFLMYRGFKIVPWIGVLFRGYAKDKSQDIRFDDMVGFNAGIGFKLFRNVQFNIESRAYSFTSYKVDGKTRSLPDEGRKEFRGSEFLVGLSFPFGFAPGSSTNSKK